MKWKWLGIEFKCWYCGMPIRVYLTAEGKIVSRAPTHSTFKREYHGISSEDGEKGKRLAMLVLRRDQNEQKN